MGSSMSHTHRLFLRASFSAESDSEMSVGFEHLECSRVTYYTPSYYTAIINFIPFKVVKSMKESTAVSVSKFSAPDIILGHGGTCVDVR